MVLALASCLLPLCITPARSSLTPWSKYVGLNLKQKNQQAICLKVIIKTMLVPSLRKKSRDFTRWRRVLATPDAAKWVRHSQNSLFSESGLHSESGLQSERLFVGTVTGEVVMITRAQHIDSGSDCCSLTYVKYTNKSFLRKEIFFQPIWIFFFENRVSQGLLKL